MKSTKIIQLRNKLKLFCILSLIIGINMDFKMAVEAAASNIPPNLPKGNNLMDENST